MSRRFLRTFVPGYTYGSIFTVKECVYSAAHLFRCHYAINVALKNCLGFIGWFEPFHANAGERIVNFFGSLFPCSIRRNNWHYMNPKT
jgi:hypothetical protein